MISKCSYSTKHKLNKCSPWCHPGTSSGKLIPFLSGPSLNVVSERSFLTIQLKYLVSPHFSVTHSYFHYSTYHYFLFSCLFYFCKLIYCLSLIIRKSQKSNDYFCHITGRTMLITYLPLNKCFLNEQGKYFKSTLVKIP